MKITQKALSQITDPITRAKLAIALRVSDQTIQRYIKSNNDELTKAAALAVIREKTGLCDSDILESEAATAA